MSQKTKNIVNIINVISAIMLILVAVFMFSSTAALAKNKNSDRKEYNSNYMTDIDFYELAGGNGKGDKKSSNLASGGANVIKVIVNSVLLPSAILVAAWKIIYIAIFPLMMRSDPLGMVSHEQYGNYGSIRYMRISKAMHASKYRKSDLDSPYDIVHQHMLPELKKFGISLGIITLVWVGLQFVMQGVVILLGFAH